MLQESRPGGEGGHSEGVASSSKSSSKPTPATLHSRLDLDTTLLPLPARAPALPKAAALAEQLALVAKAAHSYDQLLEITQGWSLSLKAVDAAWTEAQRSREKGKGRAKDASLDALGGGTEYLGSAMSNRELLRGAESGGTMLTTALLPSCDLGRTPSPSEVHRRPTYRSCSAAGLPSSLRWYASSSSLLFAL